MAAYYNEIDPYAAQWLRNLIAAGQRLIDLGMHEPPLVDVDADRVFLTDAGRAVISE